MTVQQPTIGQQVIVPADPRVNNGADVAPATVTRVFGHNTTPGDPDYWVVNVRVLPDGPVSADEWRTSVRLYATRDDADAHGQHTAWWPEQVPAAAVEPAPAAGRNQRRS